MGLSKDFKEFGKYEQCYDVLGAMVRLRCKKGCRNGGGPPQCKIRNCCVKKGIQGCWECGDFEICKKLDFLKSVHADAHIKNLRLIKKNAWSASLRQEALVSYGVRYMQPLESIMVEGNTYYESYPKRFNCVSLGIALLSYAIGAAIFYLIEPLLGFGYMLLCMLSLLAGVMYRCRFCYYYGKRCPSGLGILSKRLFKKGDPQGFWDSKNLMPAAVMDFGTLLLAVLGGVALCIIKFSPLSVALLAAYIFVAIVLGFTVKKVFCAHCEQGRLGCPAYEGMRGKDAKR